LRAAEFDVEELTGAEEQDLIRIVTDPDDLQPVIVTIYPLDLAIRSVLTMLPGMPPTADHAVVLADVRSEQRADTLLQVVEFMDPLTGTLESSPGHRFWPRWDLAGRRALLLRP
jgi:hypothetical protein